MPEVWHYERHCPRDKWYLSALGQKVSLRPQTRKLGHMKRLFTFSATAVLLASCSSGTSAPTETVPMGATVIKAVPSLRFDAKTYGPIPAGEVTFAYVNEDPIRHTLIIAKGDTKIPNFKLVIAKKGDVDSGTVTLEKGEYTLICDVPGHSNMRATLTVE